MCHQPYVPLRRPRIAGPCTTISGSRSLVSSPNAGFYYLASFWPRVARGEWADVPSSPGTAASLRGGEKTQFPCSLAGKGGKKKKPTNNLIF